MKKLLIAAGILVLALSLSAAEQGRWLKVRVTEGPSKLEVNMPVEMARFAKELLPEAARRQVEMKNIELDRVIAGLGRETDRLLLIEMGQNKVEFLLIPAAVVARPSSGTQKGMGYRVKIMGKGGEDVIVHFPTALVDLLPGFLPENIRQRHEKIINQYLKEFPDLMRGGGTYDLILAEDQGERVEITAE